LYEKKFNLIIKIKMMRGNNFKRNLNAELEEDLKAAELFFSRPIDDSVRQVNDYQEKGTTDQILNKTAQVNKSNSTTTNYEIKNDEIFKYKKQLKNLGFPDIGNLIFETEDDKIATLQFIDFVIRKKGTENEEKMKFKKQLDSLNERVNILANEKFKLEKELINSREEVKKFDKERKDNENKINKLKENYEKQISELKNSLTKLQNRNNFLTVDKKNFEERFSKISEGYNKIVNKNNPKCLNSIDLIENLKKNDLLKSLSKISGTEKLIETLKNGFNESVRELLFEITALKNFIQDINKELQIDNKPFTDIDNNLLTMPFLDTIGKIKYILKTNIYKLKDEKIEINIGQIDDVSLEEYQPVFEKEEEAKGEINKDGISNNNSKGEEEDYLSELEILKNKWVKTLMK
jgi:hypothetical protein